MRWTRNTNALSGSTMSIVMVMIDDDVVLCVGSVVCTILGKYLCTLATLANPRLHYLPRYLVLLVTRHPKAYRRIHNNTLYRILGAAY